MDICIYLGVEAERYLSDRAFLAEWTRLHAACPWATLYQGPDFVTAWYDAYRNKYQPVIVCARNQSGGLLGMLPLAQSDDRKDWVVAGKGLANYQSWIAPPEYAEAFIKTALVRLLKTYQIRHLAFLFLAPGTPTGWLDGRWQRRLKCIVSLHRRPLLIGTPGITPLHGIRKREKNHMNRLKHLGEVRFERVDNPVVFSELLEKIAVFIDVRKGATFNDLPFTRDPSLKSLLRELFHRKLLYVTTLMAGEELVAADISGIGMNGYIHGHLLAYSPFHARCSPGTLHVMMLGETLLASGQVLDFCPWGNWKEGFENAHDHVASLEVYPSLLAFFAAWLGRSVRQWLKRTGVRRSTLSQLKMCCQRPVARLQGSGPANRNDLYVCDALQDNGQPPAAPGRISVNSLSDLLTYPTDSKCGSRQAFLAAALQMMGKGGRFYTSVLHGRLRFAVWILLPENTDMATGQEPLLRLPDGAVMLSSLYCDPHLTDAASLYDFLRGVLKEQRMRPGAVPVYLLLPKKGGVARVLIQQVGFRSVAPGAIPVRQI